MKNLMKAFLGLALACGVVACEKPMEKKKEEKAQQRPSAKKHVVSMEDAQQEQQVQQ